MSCSSNTTKKCTIKIENDGVKIVSNGKVVSYDNSLTLADYSPEVTNWTSWSSLLNEGDTVEITDRYKFIFMRVRNGSQGTGNNINDHINNCFPANNSLINNCGCSSDDSNGSSTATLVEFEMNQYTDYGLSDETIWVDTDLQFDCTHGNIATLTPGWKGCEKCDNSGCGCTGGTGATGCTGGTGSTGGTGATGCTGSTGCTGGTANPILVEDIYVKVATGVLRNCEFVIKTDAADSPYNCKNEYPIYKKVDNERIVLCFDDTHGKWVFIHIDEDISEVIKDEIEFDIIELIEWSSQSLNYQNSNILVPKDKTPAGTISYSGTKTRLNDGMPVSFDVNSLFVMEYDSFDGVFTSKLNNMYVSLMLAK